MVSSNLTLTGTTQILGRTRSARSLTGATPTKTGSRCSSSPRAPAPTAPASSPSGPAPSCLVCLSSRSSCATTTTSTPSLGPGRGSVSGRLSSTASHSSTSTPRSNSWSRSCRMRRRSRMQSSLLEMCDQVRTFKEYACLCSCLPRIIYTWTE